MENFLFSTWNKKKETLAACKCLLVFIKQHPFIAPPPERNGSIKGGMKKLNE
jgi:hypothetical protein